MAGTDTSAPVRGGGCAAFGSDALADRAEYDVPVLPASHGIPARVVLYRMPLQTEAPTKLELQLAVRDELVARIAELYGRRPEEIDPDWGL
mgnify:FL=1